MSVTIDGITFDHVSYDTAGDVLYLHVGEPQAAAEAEESDEGHALRYDGEGRLIGLTIVNARWLLERDGSITVTAPSSPPLRAEAGDLAGALGVAGIPQGDRSILGA